ncbi:MAG: DUF554 domain-containing protein [Clostridiales bacterium]|nr:MAG: DUF554 domain-containing protein [Clostridiales bacterium]
MCVGAMAVVGAVNDGISGDISVLAAKSLLDFYHYIHSFGGARKRMYFSAIPCCNFSRLGDGFCAFYSAVPHRYGA